MTTFGDYFGKVFRVCWLEMNFFLCYINCATKKENFPLTYADYCLFSSNVLCIMRNDFKSISTSTTNSMEGARKAKHEINFHNFLRGAAMSQRARAVKSNERGKSSQFRKLYFARAPAV